MAVHRSFVLSRQLFYSLLPCILVTLELGDGFVDLGCCGACGYLLIVQLSAQTMLLSALPCYYRHSFIYFPRTLSYPTRLPPTTHSSLPVYLNIPAATAIASTSAFSALFSESSDSICGFYTLYFNLWKRANVLALFLLKAFLSSFDVFKHDVFAIVYIILYTSCT